MSDIYEADDDRMAELGLNLARSSSLSIREISRQSGVPYSTLQRAFQIGGGQPSNRTLALLENWAASGPVYTDARKSTWASTTDLWSDRKLANLTPPRGATHFRLVVLTDSTPSGFTSTPYDELRIRSPYDQAFALGIDARSIQKVIWTRAGSLPNA